MLYGISQEELVIKKYGNMENFNVIKDTTSLLVLYYRFKDAIKNSKIRMNKLKNNIHFLKELKENVLIDFIAIYRRENEIKQVIETIKEI